MLTILVECVNDIGIKYTQYVPLPSIRYLSFDEFYKIVAIIQRAVREFENRERLDDLHNTIDSLKDTDVNDMYLLEQYCADMNRLLGKRLDKKLDNKDNNINNTDNDDEC